MPLALWSKSQHFPAQITRSTIGNSTVSIKAQLSYPDMCLPIQYALSYPERLPNPHLSRLDWDNLKRLTFEQPDFDTFPCLKLASEAGRKGGTYPAVLCAADEVAVDPQVLHQKMILTMEHPLGGEIKLAGNPIKIEGIPEEEFAPPPTLNQHQHEILSGLLGYSEEK
jgi:crotonobetainyl-CoA:carnitine CoA-transferase CaiB-like acyl-CoA transferase